MINGIKPIVAKSTPTPKKPSTNGLSFDKAMDSLLENIQESYTNWGKYNKDRKIETPVFEETQMGLSIGLAMNGFVPVTCYPRFDFLLCAANQLVNHLDKMEEMTLGTYKPRVIIRTSIGAKSPLNGGVQHTQDHTEAFRHLLENVEVVLLEDKKNIFPEYKRALEREDEKSTLIVEYGEYYNQ